ncbi:PDDEXK family nuclease [Rhizobium ruizarguesonis]|uniref:hypothetical protein n=1 Tax=Rhizobium ruizarguesonis TaxID=2081791 RepID=UPI00102F490A|nr:hypothetical protein [Rhizobium ruizarguesonis]TAV04043.1 hypothetical protein ELI39_01460 [Rhizobium ruizarguesonis]
MSAESAQVAAKKPNARSRVTNGSKLGDDIDGRSVWARRLRDLIQLYSSDVNEDLSMIPESTKSLIRRAAVLTVELERAEAGFAEKGQADPAALSAYQTTSNSLRRLLDSLNIKPEHQKLHARSDAARVIENGRMIKAITDGFTVSDLALGVGLDTARRDVARRIAFAVEMAKRNKTPLDPTIAQMAVDLAMAQYADIDVEFANDND